MCISNLCEELVAVHYRKAPLDAALASRSLETLPASYAQQRAFYEGQQDSEAQIQLAAAERVLQSKQREFSGQLGNISEIEVRGHAASVGYVEAKLREEAESAVRALEEAVHGRAQAITERERARKEYNDKKQAAPEGGKRRFPEGEQRPGTSMKARELLIRGQATHEQRLAKKQKLDGARLRFGSGQPRWENGDNK